MMIQLKDIVICHESSEEWNLQNKSLAENDQQTSDEEGDECHVKYYKDYQEQVDIPSTRQVTVNVNGNKCKVNANDCS